MKETIPFAEAFAHALSWARESFAQGPESRLDELLERPPHAVFARGWHRQGPDEFAVLLESRATIADGTARRRLLALQAWTKRASEGVRRSVGLMVPAGFPMAGLLVLKAPGEDLYTIWTVYPREKAYPAPNSFGDFPAPKVVIAPIKPRRRR